MTFGEKLSKVTDEDQREMINAKIAQKQEEFKAEQDDINRMVYQVGVQEKAIELEVKRLDTMVSVLQKQLEAVEDAEGQAIQRAIPKYSGNG